MKKLTVLCFSITTLMFYTSCNKNNGLENPDPVTIDSATIMGFKDSTQLIKSIRYDYYDSAKNAITISRTEYYYYDTLNRKIVLSFRPVSNSTQSYDGVEYNYNSAGLLSHVSQKFIAKVIDSSSPLTSDLIYDAANVIKSISLVFVNGRRFTISFNKKALPSGGYQLTWIDPVSYNGYPDSTLNIANFDAGGKMQVYYLGSVLFDNFIYWSDSSEYDLNGNISEVINTIYSYTATPSQPDTLIYGSSSYTLYDFTFRDTKGEQLYNLDQILNNGLANFPKSLSYNFIPMTDDIDEYAYQYTKCPALSTIINTKPYNDTLNNNLINFNSTPEYDSKSRLVKYRMFYAFGGVYQVECTISYYK